MMVDEEEMKTPTDRIREIARATLDSGKRTKYMKTPPLPIYVQAIVKYLDEVHHEFLAAENFGKLLQVMIKKQTNNIEELKKATMEGFNKILKEKFPDLNVEMKFVQTDMKTIDLEEDA